MARALVGRDAERARIDAWLADRSAGTAGTPPALFVSGEAGVGKTALLRALGTGGATVLRAAAAPWNPAPYGLLAQLVPGLVRSDRHGAIAPGPVRSALLDAGRPLVLVLEDLHWSDDATLELLAPLVEALAGDPVAVIGSYRGDELPRGALVRRVRAQLRHRGRLLELALAPLEAAALARLIAVVLGREPVPALTAAVAERTEGVPFFVEELLAALSAAGWLQPDGDRVALAAGGDLPLPDTVRDAVLLRVSGLPRNSRDALDIAAVIGVDFDVATVAALSAEGWRDDLDHCGLITGAPADERGFRHALAQEAIYTEVPWSRRRALHLAVADRLAGTAGPVAAVARHLLAGHDLDRARPALVAAADTHLRAHAHRDAARLLGVALDIWPPGVDETARLGVVDRLARCAELSGEHATAVTSLRELIDRSGGAGQPPLTGPAQAHRRLAVQYELLGHWPLALTARESAADAFTAVGLPGESAVERLAIAAHLRSSASFRAALDVLDAAETSAAAADRTDLVCRIGGLRGNVLSRMGRAAEGVPAVRTALDRALAGGLVTAAGEIYQRLADSLEHAGDYRGAGHAYDAAYGFCRAHELDAAGQLCRACATVVLFQCGRWDRAVALCGEVLADAAATAHARSAASGIAGLVHAMRGRAAAARPALLDARATAGRIDLFAMKVLSTWGLALLDEIDGQPARAAESYRQVVADCGGAEDRHYCLPVLQFAVARFAEDRAVADLGSATAVLADAAARTGQPEARAAFAYALGESALAATGPEQAVPHLRRAVDLLDGLELPLVDTLVRHRTAVALAATGAAVPEATAMLRAAYRTAHRLKARPLVERIGADLDRLGIASPDQPPATLLTPREAQVLRLVGDGLTSREIGQRLFLSVRTVEMHVHNGVAKLGCRTRAQAVRRLATS